MKRFIVLLFCSVLTTVNSAKILAILHVPTPSHYHVGEALVKGLAEKGHDVTVASPLKSKEKVVNFREIHLDGLTQLADGVRGLFFKTGDESTISVLKKFSNYTNALSETAIRNPVFQDLIKNGEKFDVLIVEPFGNEALFGFAHVFNSHLIVLSTATSMWANPYTGNSAPYSYVPHGMVAYTDKMTFKERAINALVYLTFNIYNGLMIWPVQKSLYEEIFKGVPSFEETMKNVSLTLVNSHVVFETPRPYLPNMIPIAGAHIKIPKKLPQDLQAYLDNAKEGVIYFSFGSNLHSSFLPQETQQTILKTFAKFSQKVLWKFEDENIPNKPANVKISKWFPQTDVLAHPNVKLFITHGGLLSTTETVFRGVPIVGIPVYGDQYANIANLVNNGYGKSITLDELNVESFTNVLREVLENPSYNDKVKKSASLLQDQPDQPLNRAIFWVEHIIRHNGAKHLRSAVLDLPLYQYLLLDILGAATAVIIVVVSLLYLIVKKICCCCKKTDKKDVKVKRVKPKRE